MTIPFSISGGFEVASSAPPEHGRSAVIADLKDWLVASKATAISISSDRIAFRGGVFRFTTNWNILVAIGYGEITVTAAPNSVSVRYQLRCTEILMIVTAMICQFMGPMLLSAPHMTVFLVPALMLAGWLWLFGMNYLIAWLRLRAALRRIARLAIARLT